MQGVSPLEAHRVLVHIRLALKKRQTVLVLRGTNLAGFLAMLRVWGIIGHFELVEDRFLRQPIRQLRYRVSLRYFYARPAVYVCSYFMVPGFNQRLSVRTLRQLASTLGGQQLILQTAWGLLSLPECISRGIGGRLALGFSAG